MVTHQHIDIRDEEGETVKALAPVIVSASRATDIPAFYAREFFDGLEKEYTIWTNPYNGKPSYSEKNWPKPELIEQPELIQTKLILRLYDTENVTKDVTKDGAKDVTKDGAKDVERI